jgi:hypothetical protein
MRIGRGKPRFSEKTCYRATLFTTNPTWPNPGRFGPATPATNRLSCGTTVWSLQEFYVHHAKSRDRETGRQVKWLCTVLHVSSEVEVAHCTLRLLLLLLLVVVLFVFNLI